MCLCNCCCLHACVVCELLCDGARFVVVGVSLCVLLCVCAVFSVCVCGVVVMDSVMVYDVLVCVGVF